MPARETVVIRELRCERLHIPFTVPFRHASAERAETSTVWVRAISTDGAVGHGESCPRPYVTGETLETAERFIAAVAPAIGREIGDLDSLRAWVSTHEADIDASPAAWCAIELALLDLLARRSGRTVEALLGLPAIDGRFAYTAVLGDAAPGPFAAMAAQYRQAGFTDYKVKLSGHVDRDRAKIEVLHTWDPAPRVVRADANNLWDSADDAAAFLDALGYRFSAIEEPVRAGRYEEMLELAEARDVPIVLDESFLRIGQLPIVRPAPARWIVNLRVSKMGGVLRSLRLVAALREAGVRIICGAQVGETSLLTRAALTVANSARDMLIGQEGAFGTRLLVRDVCDAPLMFGAAGVLDAASHPGLRTAGFGLWEREPRLPPPAAR